MQQNEETSADCTECKVLLEKEMKKEVGYLAWRAGYTLLAWIILGIAIAPGNGAFISIMLFEAPLFIDYIRSKPANKGMKANYNRVGRYFSLICALIGFFGAIGILQIAIEGGKTIAKITEKYIVLANFTFSFVLVWSILFISVAFSIIDYIICERPEESQLRVDFKQHIMNKNAKNVQTGTS